MSLGKVGFYFCNCTSFHSIKFINGWLCTRHGAKCWNAPTLFQLMAPLRTPFLLSELPPLSHLVFICSHLLYVHLYIVGHTCCRCSLGVSQVQFQATSVKRVSWQTVPPSLAGIGPCLPFVKKATLDTVATKPWNHSCTPHFICQ